jgi:diguanylate cyclase (GGDEF)-like protein
VESLLETRPVRLRFPPAIETEFEQQMRSYRAGVVRSGAIPAAVIYNAFIVADILLMPDTILFAAFLHFCLVTPVIFLVGYGYGRIARPAFQEITAAAIPLLMVLQIMTIYSLNTNEASDHYQYLAIMVVVYMNVNQRLGSRFAIATTLTLTSTYLVFILAGHSPLHVQLVGASSMAAAGYLTLMANMRMERDVRHAFLRRLKDQLLREAAQSEANRDALTGLWNRRHLDEVSFAMWSRAEDGTMPVAVIMIDIDRFKPFNDHHGHQAGDDCLKAVADAIAAEMRTDSDVAVRYGGEEFLALLPGTEFGDAARTAERIRRAIEDLGVAHGSGGVVTASFGVAAGSMSTHSLSALISAADAALYAAKHNGKNQVWPPFPGTNVLLPGAGLATGTGD